MSNNCWQSKISLFASEFAKIIAESIDVVLVEPEKFLRFGDEAVQHLKEQKLPDWTRFYERSPKFMADSLSKLLGMPPDKQPPSHLSQDFSWAEELVTHLANVDWSSRELEKGAIHFLEQHKTKFLIQVRVQTHQLLSLIQYGKTMGQLLAEAKAGNEKSLFQALQIDKSLIGKEFVRRMVRVAELTNDVEFFERLARAIRKRPSLKNRSRAKISLVLLLLWEMGLEKMTAEETLQFLEEVFDPATLQIDDVETLRKLLNRIGLYKYKKANRT